MIKQETPFINLNKLCIDSEFQMYSYKNSSLILLQEITVEQGEIAEPNIDKLRLQRGSWLRKNENENVC